MASTLQERLIIGLSKAREAYPELEGVRISIQFKKATRVMQARIKTLFGKRTYRINISTEYKEVLEKADMQALIGWFSRELNHILSYHKRNLFYLAWFVTHYIANNNYKKKIERQTDMNVIERGLGNELLASRHIALESNYFSNVYKRLLKVYYLSPREISSAIKTKKPAKERLHV